MKDHLVIRVAVASMMISVALFVIAYRGIEQAFDNNPGAQAQFIAHARF